MARECSNCGAGKGMARFEGETFDVDHAGSTLRGGWAEEMTLPPRSRREDDDFFPGSIDESLAEKASSGGTGIEKPRGFPW